MTLEQTKRMTRAWFLTLAAVIAMLGATCICLTLVGACVEGAVKFTLELPEIPPEMVKVDLTLPPETVKVAAEAGAVTVQAPIVPEGPLNRLSTWLGVAALVAVVLWFLPSPAARIKRIFKRG